MKKVKSRFDFSDVSIVRAIKKVKKVLSNKTELWKWLSWTFFTNEILMHNSEIVARNLEFGKLLQKKETLRVLKQLKEDYKKVINGDVALIVIDEMIEITTRGEDPKSTIREKFNTSMKNSKK